MKTGPEDCARRFGRGLTVLFTLVVFLAHGAPAAAAETHPAIRSGAEIDYPPFSIVDAGGRAGGFSVELLRAALTAMGREVSFRTGPWDEVRGWLTRGEIQALPLVGRTPEREALFDFTFPYMSLYGAIVVRADETGIGTLSDLKGRTVAVMKGDNAEEFLRREDRGIHIETTATFDEAFQALSGGRSEAVVVQRLVALRLIQEKGLANLRVISRPIDGFRQDFCFAVREGDRDTLALLNEGLALVMADGTYRHLHAKWFAALELPAHRRIVVGGDHNFLPYEYLDDSGRPAGYNVDLTRAIAQAVGLDVEIRLGPWSQMVTALENGDIDILQGMFYSPQRDLRFDFSAPHEVSHYVTVVRDGEGPAPEHLSELAGRRIVVQRGDMILEHLAAQGLDGQVVLVDSQQEVLGEVAAGRGDCGLAVRISALQLIRERGWTHLRLGRNPVFSVDYGYAVKNGHKALLATVAEGLKILEESGDYRRIHDRWLGVYTDDRGGLRRALRYIAIVAAPLAVLVLTFFLWSWSLRKQVARKTRELEESADRFRYLFEAANVGKSFTRPTGEVDANQAFAEFLGYSPGALEGKKWQDLTPAGDIPEVERLIAPLLSGEKPSARFEKRYLHKNGAIVWADVSATLRRDDHGRPLYFVTTVVDITDRKQAERRIGHLNRLLRTIRDVNQLIVRERDRETLIREGCRLMVASRGYPSALIALTDDQNRPVSWAMEGLAALSAPLSALLEQGRLPPCCEHARLTPGIVLIDDREAVCGPCPIAGACAEGQSLCAPIIHRGRSFGYLAAAAESGLIVDAEEKSLFSEMAGDFAYALNTMETQAARLRGETALKESESRFRLFAELAPVGIVIYNEKENVLYANSRFTDLFGYTLEDMPSVARWWERAYPDPVLRDLVRRQWAAAVDQARLARSEIAPLEYPVTCRDGSVRQIEFRMATTGELNIVVFTDISERRRAEAERENLQAQLIQSQKMESVGRLAGGVAHDFNNMLGVIIGYAELAMGKTGASLKADLQEILAAARRSADITRQLLAFARKQIIAPKVLDLNETVENALKMLRRLIGEDIDLSWQPGGGLWPVRMDPSQLDQILANLCVNARDAIRGVGRITIETDNVTFDAAYCAEHAGFAPGQFVLLAVSDDGHGMDRETLDHLFEPFFTTKGVGEGTGLGLAMVYGIVQQHEGFINVYSEPEKGTTFRIYVPRHHSSTAEAAVPAAAQIPRGRGQTVMVVEDEAAILKLTGRILDSLGYVVLAAGSTAAALAAAEAHGGPIHLLITDVVMPGMSGRDLADRLLSTHPDLKVLFMSGYTADVIAHQGVLDEGVHFIQKPFSFAELAAKVREVIGQ